MPRDTHLFGPGPKRILSLDGGGTRGIITIAFLEQLEKILRSRHGDDPKFRLCHYFDLIGGTSTGAVIAAGLALGMSVAEVKRLYLELAPIAFSRSRWHIWGWQARFRHAPLMRLLRQHVGARTLESADLATGLAIMIKRLDTGSPWLVANSPRAPYWDDPADGSFIGNRHYELATLLRASTAAPMFFQPEYLPILKREPHGLFIDGGVSPHNNPALMLLMLALLHPYGLCWPTGEDRLLLISVGTGRFRLRLDPHKVANHSALGLAAHALRGMISDGQQMVLTMLQWMSNSDACWPINSEIGDMREDMLAGQPLFKFQRYDLELEPAWLEEHCGTRLNAEEIAEIRMMESVKSMDRNYAMASVAAGHQVQPAHLPAVFDPLHATLSA